MVMLEMAIMTVTVRGSFSILIQLRSFVSLAVCFDMLEIHFSFGAAFSSLMWVFSLTPLRSIGIVANMRREAIGQHCCRSSFVWRVALRDIR